MELYEIKQLIKDSMSKEEYKKNRKNIRRELEQLEIKNIVTVAGTTIIKENSYIIDTNKDQITKFTYEIL